MKPITAARMKIFGHLSVAVAALSLLASCSRNPAPKAGIKGVFHSPLGRIVETMLKAKEKIPGRKIVVYALPDISGRATPEGELVAERLTTRLARTGEFQVIERSRLETALKELNLAASGVIDEATAARAGRVLGAEAVVTGTLTRLDGKFEINARMIDAETGNILAAATEQLDEEDLLVKSGQPPAVYAAPRQNSYLLAQPRQQQPQPSQEPPKGWVVWPGWNGGRYGSYSYDGGKLYYRLDTRQEDHRDSPAGDGYYPGLMLSRSISGRSWTVDAKVSYHLPSASGRWFSFSIWFGPEAIRPSLSGSGKAFVAGALRRADAGYSLDSFQFFFAPGQTGEINMPAGYSYIRLERSGGIIRGSLSRDGRNFEQALSVSLPAAVANEQQRIVLSGQAHSAAGSYAEYEYIKLNGKPLF